MRRCLFLSQLTLVSAKSAKTLVHAIVSSRLDYCNSLLYGVSDELLQKLQIIQNAAARVVTGAREFDYIASLLYVKSPLVAVRQHIRFKLAMTVYKCFSGLDPAYLADDCMRAGLIRGQQTAPEIC